MNALHDISLVLHKNPHIRRVFIGSDVPPKRVVAEVRSLMHSDKTLRELVNFSFEGKPIEKPVSFHWLEPSLRDIVLDLAMMVNSEVFIGTCPSTFSAFVSRYRKFNGVGVFGRKRGSNPSFYFGMIEEEEHLRRMVADHRARRNDEL